MTTTQAPLHARFALSRGALDELAERGFVGVDARHGARVGLFRVRAVEQFDGGVRFVVHSYDVGDAGFAYSPGRRPKGVTGDSFSERYEHIDGPWYVWYRDAGSD